MDISILAGPIIGAFIGWVTNRIALWMLFHPHHAWGPSWFSWQGLIPSRKSDLAQAIARTVTEKLLTKEDLNGMLKDIDLRAYLREVTDAMIERRLSGTIRGFSLIPSPVRERLVIIVQELVAERLPERIDDLSPGLADRVIHDLAIGEHLRNRIANWPVEDVEQVTRSVAGREMRGIEMAGAILGFLVGIIQAVVLYLQ
ncbi:MAG TPA: DUF445 family protein [bacterium]|nr:DUF445 family protein [bacterium]HQO33563.1 DUF445 family protein [bacterium]HQP99516.1 DUF445 family protein [bacterium]